MELDPNVLAAFKHMKSAIRHVDRRIRIIGRYNASGQLEADPTTDLPAGYVWVHDEARSLSRAKNLTTEYAPGVDVVIALNVDTGEDDVISVDTLTTPIRFSDQAAALNSPRKGANTPTPVTAADFVTGGLFPDSSVGGLTARIMPAWLPGGARWDGSELITLTPTATANHQSFAVVMVDPSTKAVTVTLTADRALSAGLLNASREPTALGAEDIKAVRDANRNLWGVGAVLLANGDTSINPAKIADLRFFDTPDISTAASGVAFTAADSGDWSPEPDDAAEAIDQLASRVVALEAGSSALGDYLLFTHEEAQNTNGGTATSGSRQTRRLNYLRHDTGTNGSIIELAFTSGGTYEVISGNTITGATSGATATVFDVVLTSGSWAGGDAAGTLWLNGQTGTFQSENLNVGANSNVATISGNSTSSNYRFRLAAGSYRVNGSFEFYDTGNTRIWLYNVTDGADQTGVYGHASYTPSTGSTNLAIPMRGRFTIAANKTFLIQYRCTVTSSAADGQGTLSNFGGNEIYATLELTKE